MALGFLLFAAMSPAPAHAQVGDRGSLTIHVTDETQSPLQGVQVRLHAGTLEHPEALATTSSTGRVDLRLLRPGRYRLEVERLGFIPVRVTGVVVAPSERIALSVELRATEPPVVDIDEFPFASLVTRRVAAGTELLSDRLESLPLEGLSIAPLPRLARSLAGYGPILPDRFLSATMNGSQPAAAYSPDAGPGRDRFDAFPLRSFDWVGVEMARDPSGQVRGIGPVMHMSANSGQGETSGSLRVGAHLQPAVGPRESGVGAPWIEGHISAPLQGDTIRVTSAFQVRRASELLPSVLLPESLEAEVLRGVGAVGGGLPGAALGDRERDVLSGSSRLDWAIGEMAFWTLFTSATVLPEAPELVLPVLPEGVGSSTSGSDLHFASRLLTAMEGGHAIEFDVAMDRSQRIVGSGLSGQGDREWVSQLDPGLSTGPFRDSQGEFTLTRVTLAPAGTYSGENLRLRGGMTLAIERWSDLRPDDPGRARLLSGPDGNGGLTHTSVGAGRDLSLNQQSLSLFSEARWWVTSALRLTAGGRIDWQVLPFDEITPDEAWGAATGIFDAVPDGSLFQVSPSGELRWEPEGLPGWGLNLAAALHPGTAEPGLLGPIFQPRDQPSESVRTLGDPAPGDEFRGRRLTLLGPEFRAPRTESLSARAFGQITPEVRLAVEAFRYRADFLPRRRDINRIPGQGFRDQFGRSHHGVLANSDGLIAIVPGTDRRFRGFDQVWALESTGWSETAGVQFAGTFEAGELLLEGNYRFARTRDNAPFGLSGSPIPLDGSTDFALLEAGWVEGRSNTDRPHELTLLGTLGLGIGPLDRVAWSYRMASGLPFTPGVRDALGQAWETGWTRLEAISLPDGATIPVTGDGWSCASTLGSTSRLERNSCRGETLHELNAGIAFQIPAGGAGQVELRVDALNLLDRGDSLRDPALFVVDGAGELGYPSTGEGARVDLPVRDNPTFGEPIARLFEGRTIRIGLEYRF